jgi:hypothetical protein
LPATVYLSTTRLLEPVRHAPAERGTKSVHLRGLFDVLLQRFGWELVLVTPACPSVFVIYRHAVLHVANCRARPRSWRVVHQPGGLMFVAVYAVWGLMSCASWPNACTTTALRSDNVHVAGVAPAVRSEYSVTPGVSQPS